MMGMHLPRGQAVQGSAGGLPVIASPHAGPSTDEPGPLPNCLMKCYRGTVNECPHWRCMICFKLTMQSSVSYYMQGKGRQPSQMNCVVIPFFI